MSARLERLFARRSLGIRLGLEAVRAAHGLLGAPAAAVPAIHVVGTNGKGSTAALCAHALARAGRRVGLYTSPHLVRVGERVRIAGTPVDDEVLADACDAVIACEDHRSLPRPLSFFEILTLAAWRCFADAEVDVIVAEAGMGGRHDATRIAATEVVAIASIDLDHQRWLGDTRAAIAGEKAAVMVRGRPAVTVRQRDDVMEVLWRSAHEIGAPLRVVAPLARAPEGLAGEHQRHNGALALAAVRVLEPSRTAADLDGVRWPGRAETVAFAGGHVILDVAHNPAGIAALVAHLGTRPDRDRIALAVGCAADKDAAGIWAAAVRLDPTPRWIALDGFGTAGAPTPADATEVLPDADALMSWIGRTIAAGRVPCVCGSHVLVGAVLARTEGRAAPDPGDPRA